MGRTDSSCVCDKNTCLCDQACAKISKVRLQMWFDGENKPFNAELT